MYNSYLKRLLLTGCMLFINFFILYAQSSVKTKYNNSFLYAGIEVGSKGVKLSVVEIGNNAKTSGAFYVLKDTSVNTDFITFSELTSAATLNGLSNLYDVALKRYNIPSKRIHTVVSSGVKVQAEKENKTDQIDNLIKSFRSRIDDPDRVVEVVDALQEARLSHLGIIPDPKRYSTFLIDIGSGNTKGGYFPYGNTKDFYLFQLSWGTKSTANAAEKRIEEDKSIENYNKQLYRVLVGAENSEIIYAVNVSGGYPLSDNIAFSGGIAWSVATLMHPELLDNSIVAVTFEEVLKFSEKLYRNHASLSETILVNTIKDANVDKTAAGNEIKRVHQVFDQRSLMAGTGLLLKIMRQFKSIYETKQFFLIKNGQVGWISAYVDQHTGK